MGVCVCVVGWGWGWGGLPDIDMLTGACEVVRLHNQVTWSRSGVPQTLAMLLGPICPTHITFTPPRPQGENDTCTRTCSSQVTVCLMILGVFFGEKDTIWICKTKLIDPPSIKHSMLSLLLIRSGPHWDVPLLWLIKCISMTFMQNRACLCARESESGI